MVLDYTFKLFDMVSGVSNYCKTCNNNECLDEKNNILHARMHVLFHNDLLDIKLNNINEVKTL